MMDTDLRVGLPCPNAELLPPLPQSFQEGVYRKIRGLLDVVSAMRALKIN